MSDKLKQFIDQDLPMKDGDNYPQYENFLEQTIRQSKINAIPEYQEMQRNSSFGVEKPTSFETYLSKLGIDKNYLNNLHYITDSAGHISINRDDVNSLLGNLYLEQTQPTAYGNLSTHGASSVEEKQDMLRNLQKMAEDVVGVKYPKTVVAPPPKSAQESLSTGDPRWDPKFNIQAYYDSNKDTIWLSPENISEKGLSIPTHELMHRKDFMQNPSRIGSGEETRIDFTKGNTLLGDRALNARHHDEPLLEDDADSPRGERVQFFKALKKLLNK